MNPLLFGLLDKVIGTVANLMDPSKKAEAELAILRLQQDAAFKDIDTALALAKQQNDINQAEATNTSLFVSGWRPFIGWVCGAALFYQYLFRPLAKGAYIAYTGHDFPVQMPGLDENLWQLLVGMLGLGGFRTFEKVKGVA
jgi:hypothetical protein